MKKTMVLILAAFLLFTGCGRPHPPVKRVRPARRPHPVPVANLETQTVTAVQTTGAFDGFVLFSPMASNKT